MRLNDRDMACLDEWSGTIEKAIIITPLRSMSEQCKLW